jgi:CubicO group peptidase (beta-lactamase class C family)
MRAAELALVCSLACAGPAAAQGSPAPPPVDPTRLEAWLDAQIEPAMKDSGVPGVMVVVVRSDRVVLSKGYGLSDVAHRTPMRAGATLLDIASIGKSMTAVIASQLIDEGVLGLDEDVNRYLKTFHVTGPKITLRMLFGHRGAFDADLTGLFVPADGDTRTSAGELDRRLRPAGTPGLVTAYDNQGYGLIALILREVTGKDLSTLYRERLFEPAGMVTAVQGRPADGAARLARCYVVRGPDAVMACPYWLYRDALRGAGGVAATGDDMARYMRLLLNEGTLDGRQVLSARAYAALTDFDTYRFRAGMPGFARSFTQFEEFRGLTYAHGGSMPGFSSILKIYKDADVGVFICLLGGQPRAFDYSLAGLFASRNDLNVEPNAMRALSALEQLSDHFADEFIPAVWGRTSAGLVGTDAGPPEEIGGFLGHYRLAEMQTRSFALRVASWFGGVDVLGLPNGAIGVAGQGPYHRIAPYLFEDAKGQRVAFAALQGQRLMAFGMSPATFRKTDAIASPTWTLPVLAVAALTLLSAAFRLAARTPTRLRRLARSALLGFGFVFVGLVLEWQYGVRLAVIDGSIIVPGAWRLGLHVGALLLAWSALRFALARTETLRRRALAHGVLIGLANLSVVIVLILWRVIGSFPPYMSW